MMPTTSGKAIDMLLKVYSVFDMKANAFGQPFFFHQHGQAMRAIMDATSDPQSMLSRHPADFALYCIGTWDDQTGRLECQAPDHLGLVVSFLPPPAAPLPLMREG